MIYSSFHMTQDVTIAILPRIGRMSVRWVAGSKTKTKKNPLVRMEGVALMLCFRLGLIRASS